MISFEQRGSFKKLETFLKRVSKRDIYRRVEGLAQKGVDALSRSTPVRSGLTAASWSYIVEYSGGSWSIHWINSHMNKGVNIAIILQYGHGTGTGGYVQGQDYINPAIRPVFDEISEQLWKAVTSA